MLRALQQALADAIAAEGSVQSSVEKPEATPLLRLLKAHPGLTAKQAAEQQDLSAKAIDNLRHAARLNDDGSQRTWTAKPSEYLMRINQNHAPNVQFSTLAHEFGHLFLGHLGHDERLNKSARGKRDRQGARLQS